MLTNNRYAVTRACPITPYTLSQNYTHIIIWIYVVRVIHLVQHKWWIDLKQYSSNVHIRYIYDMLYGSVSLFLMTNSTCCSFVLALWRQFFFDEQFRIMAPWCCQLSKLRNLMKVMNIVNSHGPSVFALWGDHITRGPQAATMWTIYSCRSWQTKVKQYIQDYQYI